MINAEIIADSKNTITEERITTFIVRFPRIVLAELNTHRNFSRNSASSRAIPFDKMLDQVIEDPFVPIRFQRDHKGMQGSAYLTGEEHQLATNRWLSSRDKVVEQATLLNKNLNVTKQLCNRLLEPYMWHTAIITATEWENFFALRAHPAAEIHIAKLAEKMLEAYNRSIPKNLCPGQWHIPFAEKMYRWRLLDLVKVDVDGDKMFTPDIEQSLKVKIATARCARVSYLNFEGKDDYEADIKLHDSLAKMGHWSPFEHCARTMNGDEYYPYAHVEGLRDADRIEGWSGNLKGFVQYRKMFKYESKKDSRIIVK
jgi:thymidylate synthase ThyX